MSANEYEGFRDDIKGRGQNEPIWTFQGKIIDGRHRYKACRELGIKPQFREWTGNGEELITFIFSQNFYRRHLDESQRAMVGARFMRLLEPLAKARMLAGKAAPDPDPVANLPEGQHGPQPLGTRTRDIAAAKFNVSGQDPSGRQGRIGFGTFCARRATVKVGWNDAVGGRVARHVVAVSKMVERLPHFSIRHAEVPGKA